ncbi:uncharacterized protein MONOS_463 [Monocercomonoides exilis]|uniref:uncharacterized protein n=1 Tax=Monocercomonoides exilis TaxID=2049356 RepID=UPI003559BAFF|nr:hypothetical protein MONOS_463 [Monocercomonoides exilis]|eukprot:MONOS_463.1-p1 / transcript=MONOS_463.1 / gene=MONOS_463 / organism=Monocercomonoides_exilis_PA203 / gene_product=unspecified product / transcript_product=unspecified product / location=Mono_scaffold00007:186141-187481(+) / protein_length=447 / sequence_SO=supercontig / SO=protein_coding / is_pseudo=false
MKQLMEDLDKVEEEMKKVTAKDEESKKEREEEEYMIVCTSNTSNLQNEEQNFDKEYLPFNRVKMPLFTKYETATEYEFDYNLKKRLHFHETDKFLYHLLNMLHHYDPSNNFDYEPIEGKDKITVPLYHYSFAALSFNHTLKCISAIYPPEDLDCEEIVVCPYFQRLVNRMKHPFPLQSPVGILNLKCDAFQIQTLESVQQVIDVFVLHMLTNVGKELSFIFEMGYVNVLFEWLVNGRDTDPQLLFYAVQEIREKCIIFIDAARKMRIKEGTEYNEMLISVNESAEDKNAGHWQLARSIDFQLTSMVETDVCFDHEPRLLKYEYQVPKKCQLQLINLDEDKEELLKGENVGAHLLRMVDDIIEEKGIRDLVEATPQTREIQLFWFCSGTLPKTFRVYLGLFKDCDKISFLCKLPSVSFELPPVDLFSSSSRHSEDRYYYYETLDISN